MEEIFDTWPERYDQWFETPIGKLVKTFESNLILEMLTPLKGERILDAGCGTGVFTQDVLSTGAQVAGLEISLPMLQRAREKLSGYPFHCIQGDIMHLPFSDHAFDKSVSITTIEFVEDARRVIQELFRVTQPGGSIICATLNLLSPWAERRKAAGEKGHSLFKHAIFRSPDDIADLSPVEGRIKTAIHFQRDADPRQAEILEKDGQSKGLLTGAFLCAKWIKPNDK